ncbi:hypothetical protein HDK77DRAFT_450832 [Phyllosticta capitalensis]|uniref:Secreted protein n=1 Tax=Phyllosticta capitalensis TaxID=121624 RepID=A0ABR1YIL8_9PEZI
MHAVPILFYIVTASTTTTITTYACMQSMAGHALSPSRSVPLCRSLQDPRGYNGVVQPNQMGAVTNTYIACFIIKREEKVSRRRRNKEDPTPSQTEQKKKKTCTRDYKDIDRQMSQNGR